LPGVAKIIIPVTAAKLVKGAAARVQKDFKLLKNEKL